MKFSRRFFGIIGLLFIIAVVVIWYIKKQSHPKYPEVITDSNLQVFSNVLSNTTKFVPPSEPLAISDERTKRMERMRKVWNVKKMGDLTDEEKAELAEKFNKRLKPAIEKWCKAYQGRVPFNPEDVTLQQFNSRMGNSADRYQYIFLVNGYTLTLLDQWKDFARVFYMSDPHAMKAINARPELANPPDITVPITRADVLHMAQADTGIAYQPNQVMITPTGIGSALAGGAFVDVNKQMSAGGGGEIIMGKSISLVFGSDGKIVAYNGPFNLDFSTQR